MDGEEESQSVSQKDLLVNAGLEEQEEEGEKRNGYEEKGRLQERRKEGEREGAIRMHEVFWPPGFHRRREEEEEESRLAAGQGREGRERAMMKWPRKVEEDEEENRGRAKKMQEEEGEIDVPKDAIIIAQNMSVTAC